VSARGQGRFFSRQRFAQAVWLKRGAEAELRRTEFLGRAAVEKFRVPKAYRLPALDEGIDSISGGSRDLADDRAFGPCELVEKG